MRSMEVALDKVVCHECESGAYCETDFRLHVVQLDEFVPVSLFTVWLIESLEC